MTKKVVLLSDACVDTIRVLRGTGGARKRWREVADEIGISPNYLFRILNRRRGANAAAVSKIAEYTGLPYSDVFVQI